MIALMMNNKKEINDEGTELTRSVSPLLPPLPPPYESIQLLKRR